MTYCKLKAIYFKHYRELYPKENAGALRKLKARFLTCCCYAGQGKEDHDLHFQVEAFINVLDNDQSYSEDDKLVLFADKLICCVKHDCLEGLSGHADDFETPLRVKHGYFVIDALVDYFEIDVDTLCEMEEGSEYPMINYQLVLEAFHRRFKQLEQSASASIRKRCSESNLHTSGMAAAFL